MVKIHWIVVTSMVFGLPMAGNAPALAPAPEPLVAAQSTGGLRGLVRDGQGNPIEGAVIRLYKLDFGGMGGGAAPRSAGPLNLQGRDRWGPPTRTVRTDKEGRYQVEGLEPMSYRWTVGERGRPDFRAGTVQVRAGEVVEHNIDIN